MVKQGYKQTEIGVIPEDWDIASLKDITDGRFTYGVNAPAVPYAPSLPNYIRITDISEDGYFLKENRTSVECSNWQMFVLKENDIVFSRTGASTGKTYLYRKYDGDLVYAGFLIKASVLPEKANSKFIFDNLHTQRYWDWVKVTSMRSGQPGINGNEYARFLIPYPSIIEQERIANALSDIDGMISSLEKLISKKKAVKQGAMQELLTGKKRLSGFDGEWKVVQLSDVGYISGSGVDKKILPDEEPITLLNFTNVYHQVEISRKDLKHQVTASLEKIKNCSVMEGDVFLTPTSETPEDIALSAVASEDMSDVVYSYHVIRLRPNKDYNGRFINYAFSTPMFREQAVKFAEGSGIRYVITLKKFKEMTIYIPTDKKEQDKIVEILSDMDNEIEALAQKLVKTRKLKQGMVQQLLTGKIRLV